MKSFRIFVCSFFLLIFTSLLFGALEPEYRFGIIARLITAILAGENYVHPDPSSLSEQLFQEYLKALDPNHLYFTKTDIKDFRDQLGDLYARVCRGDTSFAFIAYNKLVEKSKLREEYAKKLLKKEFDFKEDDDYVFDRAKADWTNAEAELDVIWEKKLKNDILTFKMMDKISSDTAKKNDEIKSKVSAQLASDTDRNNSKINSIISTKSLSDTGRRDSEPTPKQFTHLTPEQRTLKRLKTYKMYLEENESIDVLEIFLSTLARLYDPHSSYMSPRSEDDFNTQMQLSFVGIGALLSSEDGYIKVEKILPGGPAEKSRVLKAADRIVAVGEEGAVPVDVIDMPINKVVDKIRGKKGSSVYLTILDGNEGAMAVPKVVSIMRGTVELKSSEASSEIREIKNPQNGKSLKLGIITLPSFYLDFLGANRGDENYRSSTKDVKKILEQFSKEKVDGVVVDLRSNGGGSLKEAVDLTGLFIKHGPIVQTKDSRGNIKVEEDESGNALYNGPLIVLINKLSASASEIFAGAIQDYKRGIVVGDKNTHGKGTVQTVVDLANLLSRFNLDLNGGAIKLTNAKFYRVNGSSTQNKGVVSDIPFKSFLDCMDIGEDSLEHAMPWDSVEPATYNVTDEKISSALPVLTKKSSMRLENNPGFKNLNVAIGLYQKIKDKKSVSLNEKKRWTDYQDEMKILDEQKELSESIITTSLKTDTGTKKDKDIYLDESLNILVDYIDYLRNYKNSSNKLVLN